MPAGTRKEQTGTDKSGNPTYSTTAFRYKKRDARTTGGKRKSRKKREELLAIDISKLTIKKIK